MYCLYDCYFRSGSTLLRVTAVFARMGVGIIVTVALVLHEHSHPAICHGEMAQNTATAGSENSVYATETDIRNSALVARIMKTALPENAKIAKEAKECMQECVSEFISFITSEGAQISSHPGGEGFFKLTNRLLPTATASEKCQQEKRKTVNGEDILFAMTSLGFENYAEALKIYLAKYREVSVDPLPVRSRTLDNGC